MVDITIFARELTYAQLQQLWQEANLRVGDRALEQDSFAYGYLQGRRDQLLYALEARQEATMRATAKGVDAQDAS